MALSRDRGTRYVPHSPRREVQAARNAGTGRLIIGRELKPNGKPGALLHADGPAHLLTLAPTRSGKGVGAVIPNLLTAERSVPASTPKATTRASHTPPAAGSDRSMSSTRSASPDGPPLPTL